MPTPPPDRASSEADHRMADIAFRWALARLRLRLRRRPDREGHGPRPRFELVIDLADAVIAVDGTMVEAWGRRPDELRRWALRGAVDDVMSIHRTEVTQGLDAGTPITVIVGGIGTSALALDPLSVLGSAPGHRRAGQLLAIGRGDQVLLLAPVPTADPTTVNAVADRLRRLAAGHSGPPPSARSVVRCLPGGRLAIFRPEGP